MCSFPYWILSILLFICIHRTRTFDGCLCVEEFVNGLELPVSLVNANDGLNRIFVAEQKGVVHIFYPDGTKIPEPFIDVSSSTGDLGKKSSAGLTDIAFHPKFRANGLFYMLVSTPTKKTKYIDHYSNLFEFKVSATDKNKADPDYSRLLLQFDQPGPTHDANKLLFGIDNYLYIFTGDGNFEEGPGLMFSQDMDTFLGKVLRIDVDSRTGDLAYGIPQDNPFNNGSYPKPEIYALGLRNPWRAGMDAGDRKTGEERGRIIIGDVGQTSVEELDLLEKGANYGWNVLEGTRYNCMQSWCLRGPEKFTDPIFSYARSTGMGRSVIGGQFYRGCRSPNLNGIYLWGDHTSRLLFRLTENKTAGTWGNKEVEMCNSNVCKAPLQSSFVGRIISFGLDEEGEVYMVSSKGRHPYKKHGYVYRFVEPSQPGDAEPCRPKATQEKTKSFFYNFPKSITNSKEARNEEPESMAVKDNQRIQIDSDRQPEAMQPITKTTTPQTTTITTPLTTTPTPTPTTKPMTPTLKASEPNPTPKEKGNLDSHGSVIEDQKSDVKGDVSETVAGSIVNGDDADNVERENPSSTETSDADVVTKLSSVLDIFKKGNYSLNETFSRFLGRLLARIYHSDFSRQGDDNRPQVVSSARKPSKSDAAISDAGATKRSKSE